MMVEKERLRAEIENREGQSNGRYKDGEIESLD